MPWTGLRLVAQFLCRCLYPPVSNRVDPLSTSEWIFPLWIRGGSGAPVCWSLGDLISVLGGSSLLFLTSRGRY